MLPLQRALFSRPPTPPLFFFSSFVFHFPRWVISRFLSLSATAFSPCTSTFISYALLPFHFPVFCFKRGDYQKFTSAASSPRKPCETPRLNRVNIEQPFLYPLAPSLILPQQVNIPALILIVVKWSSPLLLMSPACWFVKQTSALQQQACDSVSAGPG